MDNSFENEQAPQPEEEKKGYVPRPAWQVWAARIGLVVFILFLILEYVKIIWGGS